MVGVVINKTTIDLCQRPVEILSIPFGEKDKILLQVGHSNVNMHFELQVSVYQQSCRIVIRLDNFYIVYRVLTIGDVIGCGYIDSNRMLKIPFLNHEKRFLLFTSGCPLPGTR